jgi:hypothetical protein
MIRRDYILRMIEEFCRGLARLRAYVEFSDWKEATDALDGELQKLIGLGASAVVQKSETELLANVIRGEATSAVAEKTLMLVRLLKEAGDVAVGQGQAEQSHTFYLKGLHLLLQVIARGEALEFPEFVPQVEAFVQALQDMVLPMPTQAMLMQHYEKADQFAKAENALFAILDQEPDNPNVLDLGIAFFRRLEKRSDRILEEGELPRPELEAGLKELQGRRAGLSAYSSPSK